MIGCFAWHLIFLHFIFKRKNTLDWNHKIKWQKNIDNNLVNSIQFEVWLCKSSKPNRCYTYLMIDCSPLIDSLNWYQHE